MIIGFDAKRLFNNFTGLGNYSRTLVKNLQAHYPDNEYHLFTSLVKKTAETEYFFNSDKFTIHQKNGPFRSYWRSRTIVRDLLRAGIEVFHGLSNELPFGIQRSGIKSVVTIHDLIFKVFPNHYALTDRMIYDYKSKYACKAVDAIVAISDCTKNDIIKYYNISQEKIHLIRQTCHDAFKRDDYLHQIRPPQIEDLPNKYILSVGSIIPRKNQLNLVKAIKAMPPEISLILVGTGKTYKKEIEYYVRMHDLKSRVIFVDSLPNDALPYLYKKAVFSAYLSLYEGFGIPVLESLFSGTPVITSNLSSMKEFNFPGCHQVDPRNVREIVKMMDRMLQKKSKNDNLFKNSLKKYEGKELSKEMIQLYQKIIYEN